MKKIALALALLAAGFAPAFAQIITSWTFETSLPATAGPFAAEVGTGSALGLHAGASTYSSPVGNGSTHSFSSNTWAIGDYYQFQTATTGFSGIAVSWDQTSSNTGPAGFKLAYSTDGTNFTDFASYNVIANSATPIGAGAWTGATVNSAYRFNYDLSAISALNSQAAVYFRLVDTNTMPAGAGSTFGAGGTNRVDNFTISAIPEPSTYALLLGFAGFAGALLRRRRTAAI